MIIIIGSVAVRVAFSKRYRVIRLVLILGTTEPEVVLIQY